MTSQELKIFPFFHLFSICKANHSFNSHFLNAIQQVVDSIIPESIWNELKTSDTETIFYRLFSILPIFKHSPIDETSHTLTISYLYPAEYSHHARKYVVDTLCKWLIPGKQIETTGGLNLNFHFNHDTTHRFAIAQEMIAIRSPQENAAIRRNLPHLMSDLQQKLTCEFMRQSGTQIHPIFMPRNEEETIRNLIVLATQIKYVRDAAQVSIHYETQTDSDLTFTVIIARLLTTKLQPLRQALEKSSLKMDVDDVRIMGYVKQKYPKEAAVLRFTLDKKPFFRPDFSVDLLRARQKIVSELKLCLGEFRDFNGGMILRQDEALGQLRSELGQLSPETEFLLENYFYSLQPAIMQTVHDTAILKSHFQQLLAVQSPSQPFQVVGDTFGKFFLCFMAATSPSFKEEVLNAISPLNISSRDLTTCFLKAEHTSAMGFILRMECPEAAKRFQSAVLNAFKNWSQAFYCPIR